jgi:hypothetical protein
MQKREEVPENIEKRADVFDCVTFKGFQVIFNMLDGDIFRRVYPLVYQMPYQ